MRYDDLQKAWRVEYKFTTIKQIEIEEGLNQENKTIQYATSKILTTKRELNEKLNELKDRDEVIEIVVIPLLWSKN